MRSFQIKGITSEGKDVYMILTIKDATTFKKMITDTQSAMIDLSNKWGVAEEVSLMLGDRLTVVTEAAYGTQKDIELISPCTKVGESTKVNIHNDRMSVGVHTIMFYAYQYEQNNAVIHSAQIEIEEFIKVLESAKDNSSYHVNLTRDQLNNAIDYISFSDNDSARELIDILKNAADCYKEFGKERY